MIYSIKGKIIHKEENFLVIETGGIGFRVFVLNNFFKNLKLQKNIYLFIYFYIREGNIELYGFENIKELKFFELLNSIIGIGPKLALAILNKNNPSVLSSIIRNNKIELLTRVSGIGKKTAERIILELKNKIPHFTDENKEMKYFNLNLEIIDALVNIGYSKKEAELAIKNINNNIESFEEGFKKALRFLNKK